MTQLNDSRELHELSGALVMYSARLVRAVSRRTSQEIPAATLRLLSQVEELGPIGITHLARADRCSQPTMSASIANLTGKGWATKEVNPEDARSSLVRISDLGRAVLTDARHKNADVITERLAADPRHSIEDLRSAVALLQHLLTQDTNAKGSS